MALTIADKPPCYNPPTSDISTLYTFIPAVVKSRLPILTSFRRNVRMPTTRRPTPPYAHLPSEGSRHEFTRPDSPCANRDDGIVTREQLWQVPGCGQGASPERMSSTPSSSAIPPRMVVAPLDNALVARTNETRTGIEWDTAVTALLLLSKACARAQNPEAKPENTRALIVDASKWLLRSLPDHLDPCELEGIGEVMPIGLNNRERISRPQARRPSQTCRSDKRSWLHRVIASFILHVSIFIAMIIPYITALAHSCYRLERRHHLTERLLAGGIDVTNFIGESGMELKDAMVRLGQGRLADAVVYTGGWILESVVGGVTDGAGEGVAILGEAFRSRQRQHIES